MAVFAFIIIGLVAGFLSGLLGIGGGIVIIPALISCFHYLSFDPKVIVHLAMGTSLTSIVLTSAATTFHQYQKKAIVWKIWKPLLPGLILGVLCGVVIADWMRGETLQAGFAILLGIIALKMAFWHDMQLYAHPTPKHYLILGLVTGIISGIFGLGGGVILVPALQLLSIPIHFATATSAACLWPTVLVGAIAQIVAGWNEIGLPDNAWGYVYWPAAGTIGLMSMVSAKYAVRLAHSLPKQTLSRVFAAVLVLVAIKLLI